jgi:hypothetical protein
MNKPTGKLAFAYATIMKLEARIAELEAAQQPEASVAGEREADALTQLIHRLNSNVYNLTKDECIEEAKKLRAALANKPPAQVALTKEDIRGAGRVIHSDGVIDFINLVEINALIAARTRGDGERA